MEGLEGFWYFGFVEVVVQTFVCWTQLGRGLLKNEPESKKPGMDVGR